MKPKSEPKTVGPLKDEDFVPWNGVTLNRCLAIAAIAALLSVGFQVLQESVDSDDLTEAENDILTTTLSDDQQESKSWFEGWFGSSTPDLPVIEEPDLPETEEPDISEVEEPEEPIAEESELTDEEIETEPLLEEPVETEKQEEKKEKQKKPEQWGLKSKGRYMEAKGVKIRRAAEDGSQSRQVFPFNLAKKPKDSAKPYSEERQKPYKDTKYQKKYNERKYDSPKKQEFEKSSRKERDEHDKYFKQDKGKKEDKEYKAYKHYEKDYKKKYDSRHHG
ncbi:junctional sarcoplasmic reticulum protein 1 isoform 1-T2 [Mantella aurantiaca]